MVSGSYGYHGYCGYHVPRLLPVQKNGEEPGYEASYCGYQWLSVVVHGFLILVVSGYQWFLWLLWLSVVMHGYLWLSVVVHGYHGYQAPERWLVVLMVIMVIVVIMYPCRLLPVQKNGEEPGHEASYCGYQWLSVVVHGFLILVVSGYQWFLWLLWLSVVMHGYLWLSVVVHGYCGYQWLCMVICGYQWLCMVICGYQWLSVVI